MARSAKVASGFCAIYSACSQTQVAKTCGEVTAKHEVMMSGAHGCGRQTYPWKVQHTNTGEDREKHGYPKLPHSLEAGVVTLMTPDSRTSKGRGYVLLCHLCSSLLCRPREGRLRFFSELGPK